MSDSKFSLGAAPAIRIAAAGIGAAVAGPLGAALGGWIGSAIGKGGAELIEKYTERFGEKAGEKLFESVSESLIGTFEETRPRIEDLYREALRRSLAATYRQARWEGFDDWFSNWENCLAVSVPLVLEQITWSMPDDFFRRTMEQLDAQGKLAGDRRLSLKLQTRVLPDALFSILARYVPDYLQENINELLLKPDYEAAWKQLEIKFRQSSSALLLSIKADTDLLKAGQHQTIQILENLRRAIPDSAEASLSARNRVENFIVECVGPEGNLRPFGGRSDLISELNRWVLDPSASPYQLVTAPGGTGKSMLLARWWRQLAFRRDTVFVPVSDISDTNQESTFLPVLAALLSIALHLPESGFGYTPAEARERISLCFERAGDNGTPLVLVIDGLDELNPSSWALWGQLFPRGDPSAIGKKLRLLVSARSVIGDEGDWMSKLRWSRSRGLSRPVIELQTLDTEGITEVLNSARLGVELLGQGQHQRLLEQLVRLTNGDPLILGLYVDELSSLQTADLAMRILRLPATPEGQSGFFKDWFRQLDLNPGKYGREGVAMMRVVLRLLATALGPLTWDDIMLLFDGQERERSLGVRDLLPLARFVIGSGTPSDGYRLTHPRFGSYFRERDMTATERASFEARFVDSGRQLVLALNSSASPDGVSSNYFVRFYSDHLTSSKASMDEIAGLVSDGWMNASLIADPSGKSLLRDLEQAVDAASTANAEEVNRSGVAPWLYIEAFAPLCARSLNARLLNVTPELVRGGLEFGLVTKDEVFEVGMNRNDRNERSEILIALLNGGLVGQRRCEVAEAAWEACLQCQNRELLRQLIPYLSNEILSDIRGRCATDAIFLNVLRDQLSVEEIESILIRLVTEAPNSSKTNVLLELLPALRGVQIDRAIDWFSTCSLDELGVETYIKLQETCITYSPHRAQEIIERAFQVVASGGPSKIFLALWPYMSEPQKHGALRLLIDNSEIPEKLDVEEWETLGTLLEGKFEEIYPSALQALERAPSEKSKLYLLRYFLAGASAHLRKEITDRAIGIWVNLIVDKQSLQLLVPFYLDLPSEIREFAFDRVAERLDGLDRAELWLALLPFKDEPGRRETVLRAISEMPRAASDFRAASIINLVCPWLSPPDFEAAIQAAGRLRASLARTRAFSDLSGLLPGELKIRAVSLGLAASREIGDWYEQFDVLDSTIRRLAPTDVSAAAAIATQSSENIPLQCFGSACLAQLIADPSIRKSLIDSTLELCRSIVSAFSAERILAAVVCQDLDREQQWKALDVAISLNEKSSSTAVSGTEVAMAFRMRPGPTQASLIAQLASGLGDSELAYLLKSIQNIKGDRYKADVMLAIAHLLAPKLLEPSLLFAGGLESTPHRALVTAALAAHCAPERKEAVAIAALELTRDLSEVPRAVAMAHLAGLLTEEALQGIATILMSESSYGIEFISRKREAMLRYAELVSPIVRESTFLKLLERIRTNSENGYAFDFMRAILPYADERLLELALRFAGELSEEEQQIKVLCVIAEYLPPAFEKSALELTANLKSKAAAAKALTLFRNFSKPVVAEVGTKLWENTVASSGQQIEILAHILPPAAV